MKRSVILLIAGVLACSGCGSGDKLSAEEQEYVSAISNICMEWGADKQTVADRMKDCELKYDGGSIMDYFVSDKDHVVVYDFDENGLSRSVLRVRGDADVSVKSILKEWKYEGSSLEMDAGTMITSMVDIYLKNSTLATTYTIEYKGETYRIIGFASVKGL